jgi:diketogulonate reductase-like aldo/keto reductase
LQAGFDAGMTLVDTAEMYADGGAEEVAGDALARLARRKFLSSARCIRITRVQRAPSRRASEACRRLRTDRLDLYLLHWRGRIPLAETVEAFETLKRAGKILRWGVSNFDTEDIEEVVALARRASLRGQSGSVSRWRAWDRVVARQALRTPFRSRSWRIRRWVRATCCAIRSCARSLTRSAQQPAQVALAWLLRDPHVIAIPKTSSVAHVGENRAGDVAHAVAANARAHRRSVPPPSRATRLAVI